MEVCSYMPLCALIKSRIFCVSGGLSPKLTSLEQLREIQRPLEVPDEGLICDLLCSEPEDVKGFGDVLEAFLKSHDLDLMVQGNHVVAAGYEYFAEGKRPVGIDMI